MGEPQADDGARNHAFAAAVNGKSYVIGSRTGHGFILSATNTDVVEEYDPANDMWSAPKERMPTPRSGGGWGTDGRRIYVAGGEVTTKQLVGAFRGIEAYDPATNSWATLPPCPCRVMALTCILLDAVVDVRSRLLP